MDRPEGGKGARAALSVHLLREHRAAALLVAIRACGLTPVEAIIAGPEGEQEAITFGWPPPFPTRSTCCAATPTPRRWPTGSPGAAFAAIEPDERSELVTLLQDAAAAVA